MTFSIGAPRIELPKEHDDDKRRQDNARQVKLEREWDRREYWVAGLGTPGNYRNGNLR